ncbi:DUF2244 domain-containing protein [Lentilitoribacter sp. Alg239-R112]|jgi:uncharacterized membrane protein|uniref:DUF2244 domain-containing protein n=1 Tax=Lentilitoribacter sp. Alg239-R112 TaxID=2305987 RepID=UPI0013A6D109|nr:DUF2244 domain-containing protein [Lentilitoribacter sp. Alg239-R112]
MNDKLIFEAFLTPHRSLGRLGFIIFAVIISAMAIGHMIVFFVAGAWPVAFFFGFDLLLIFGAFWLNYRSGRTREEISLSRIELKIKKISASGQQREHLFNPLWSRFDVSRHDEIGITDMKISAREAKTCVGSFLNPDDRESFANAFSSALATVKRK